MNASRDGQVPAFAGNRLARETRESPHRVQAQAVVAPAPARCDRAGSLEHDHVVDPPPLQSNRHAEPGRPGSDHDHLRLTGSHRRPSFK